MQITEMLFSLADKEYASFQSGLNPTVNGTRIIGVRVPLLRALVKDYKKNEESKLFLESLPHTYFDENMVHSLLLNEIKDYTEAITKISAFLPYVDNWAVSDTLKPKVFAKHKTELLEKIKEWTASEHEFTVRFGITTLMDFYLDRDFNEEVLPIATSVRSDKYYINMALAWFFATALAKQWDVTLPIIESKTLSPWVQNKTIRKSIESFRITDEQKTYLRTLSLKE